MNKEIIDLETLADGVRETLGGDSKPWCVFMVVEDGRRDKSCARWLKDWWRRLQDGD